MAIGEGGRRNDTPARSELEFVTERDGVVVGTGIVVGSVVVNVRKVQTVLLGDLPLRAQGEAFFV